MYKDAISLYTCIQEKTGGGCGGRRRNWSVIGNDSNKVNDYHHHHHQNIERVIGWRHVTSKSMFGSSLVQMNQIELRVLPIGMRLACRHFDPDRNWPIVRDATHPVSDAIVTISPFRLKRHTIPFERQSVNQSIRPRMEYFKIKSYEAKNERKKRKIIGNKTKEKK